MSFPAVPKVRPQFAFYLDRRSGMLSRLTYDTDTVFGHARSVTGASLRGAKGESKASGV